MHEWSKTRLGAADLLVVGQHSPHARDLIGAPLRAADITGALLDNADTTGVLTTLVSTLMLTSFAPTISAEKASYEQRPTLVLMSVNGFGRS